MIFFGKGWAFREIIKGVWMKCFRKREEWKK